jgi:hypothetical protein
MVLISYRSDCSKRLISISVGHTSITTPPGSNFVYAQLTCVKSLLPLLDVFSTSWNSVKTFFFAAIGIQVAAMGFSKRIM